MEQAKDIVEAAQTADDVNKAVEELQKLDHALTSKKSPLCSCTKRPLRLDLLTTRPQKLIGGSLCI